METINEISTLTTTNCMLMSNQNQSSSSFWNVIKALGLIIAIPAGIAEFSGKNISNWIDNKLGSNNNKINCLAPNLIGKSESVAILELKQSGFQITQKRVYNNGYQIGLVISQYPLPNEEIVRCEGKFYIEVSAPQAENDKILKTPSTRDIEEKPQVQHESNTAEILKWLFYIIFGVFGLYYLFKLLWHILDIIL